MTADIRRVADIATGQHGAITASQIGAAGISSSGLRSRVQSGVLERTGSHTFRSPFAASTPLADLAALVLDCGQDAFVSGPTAAALHGFDGYRLRPPFHVTIIRGRNVQRAHHHIHTTTELPLIDRATVSALAAMSATRTLIDVARFVSSAALDGGPRFGAPRRADVGRPPAPPHRGAAVARALRHPAADRRDRGHRGQPGRPQLARTTLPRALRRRWSAPSGDPAACSLAPRTTSSASTAGSPERGVVVELLGYRWHRTTEQLTRDAARMNALRPRRLQADAVHVRPRHSGTGLGDRPDAPGAHGLRLTPSLCHRIRRRTRMR